MDARHERWQKWNLPWLARSGVAATFPARRWEQVEASEVKKLHLVFALSGSIAFSRSCTFPVRTSWHNTSSSTASRQLPLMGNAHVHKAKNRPKCQRDGQGRATGCGVSGASPRPSKVERDAGSATVTGRLRASQSRVRCDVCECSEMGFRMS